MAASAYSAFQSAFTRMRESYRDAERLVERFGDVAERLVDWEEVGFEGPLGDGQEVSTRLPKRVRLDESPTLIDIYRAVQKWRDSVTELKSAFRAMEKSEQQEALERYPELQQFAN